MRLFSVHKVMVVTTHTAYMGHGAQPKYLEHGYKTIGTASSSSNILGVWDKPGIYEILPLKIILFEKAEEISTF